MLDPDPVRINGPVRRSPKLHPLGEANAEKWRRRGPQRSEDTRRLAERSEAMGVPDEDPGTRSRVQQRRRTPQRRRLASIRRPHRQCTSPFSAIGRLGGLSLLSLLSDRRPPVARAASRVLT